MRGVVFICVWVREYAIRYFGKTSVPLVTYQEEEEGSGVVPILELYKCLAAMPVCKTSLVRCSLSSLASPVKIGDDVEQSD